MAWCFASATREVQQPMTIFCIHSLSSLVKFALPWGFLPDPSRCRDGLRCVGEGGGDKEVSSSRHESCLAIQQH